MEDQKSEILQAINRHINCLSEENRNTRKRAIEGIRKETIGKKPAIESAVLGEVCQQLLAGVLMPSQSVYLHVSCLTDVVSLFECC